LWKNWRPDECAEKTKEGSKMYKIAVIPGDGTGPEVVREGLKVLGGGRK